MIVVAGSLNMDLVGQVPRLPDWGETVMGHGLARFAGGKGGNQAVAAARLGAPVALAAAVGDDPFGAELRAGLQAEGIDTTAVCCVPGASGCALIHVRPDGNNAITVLPGANLQAPPPPQHWPPPWRWLLLQLEVPMATNLAWARVARQAGAAVVLNAAPMDELPAELLRALTLLVVNEGELQALLGRTSSASSASPGPAALQAAAALGPARVVVTLGAAGCSAWDGSDVITVPGRRVKVVDSTGAGDTFTGALVASLWQQRPFADCLARANAAAAISCTVAGARGGMPDAATLEASLTP